MATPDDVDALLEQRKKSHGDFADKANLAQATKALWRKSPNWDKLTAVQREGLEHIVDKVTRALVGDPTHQDHWADIEGYARRIRENS